MSSTKHRTPLIPRMHLFELHDQEWFPQWVRERCQAALTIAWSTHVPFLTISTPANMVASVLSSKITNLSDWVLLDFCSGAGGPTPSIEAAVNRGQRTKGQEEVLFVCTDIRPHPGDWEGTGKRSRTLRYERESVDATKVGKEIVEKYARSGSEKPLVVNGIGQPGGALLRKVRHQEAVNGDEDRSEDDEEVGRKKVFRMFSLAFHHFDDKGARAIMRDTVRTSDGFGIFELQDRTLPSFIMCFIFLIGILARAPEFCWRWGSPMTFPFVYIFPIIPFTLWFDGIISCLRTRTPDEVEALLRSCGEDASEWEVQSGRELHFWPFGYVSWIVGQKKDKQ